MPTGEATAQGQPEVSILIVGYNSLAHLDPCLSAVPAAAGQVDHEVLFVNNGTDNSADHVALCYPQVRVVAGKGNIGFAAGNNLLASHARGDWLLLLNPDTVAEPASFERLLAVARHSPDYSAFGGMRIDHSGASVATAIEFPSPLRLWRGLIGTGSRARARWLTGQISEVEGVSGEFMLVHRDTWDSLGGMDPGFFLYAEELDFFWRLRKQGRRVAMVADSRVFHDVGSGATFSSTRMLFQYRGYSHFLNKNIPQPNRTMCLLLLWLTVTTRYLAALLFRRKSPKFAAMAVCYKDLALNPRGWMQGYTPDWSDPRRNAGARP